MKLDSVRNVDKAFGGIQLICAGSCAFQSKTFTTALPHRIHLNLVIRQDEPELVEAINQLCLEKPTNETI